MRQLALIFCFFAIPLNAQLTPAGAHTKVELVALSSAAVPGKEFQFALRFRCDEHYHIYWKNPGDAGDIPAWKWTVQEDSAGNRLEIANEAEWPAPKRVDLQGVMNFVYEGETHLFLTAKIPANAQGEITVKGHVAWLECDDKGCYPQESDVVLRVKVGNSAVLKTPADWARVPRETYNVEYTHASEPTDQLRLTEIMSGRTLATVLAPIEWFPSRNFVSPSISFGPLAMTSATVNGKPSGLAITTLSLKDAPEALDSGALSYIALVKDNRSQEAHWVNVVLVSPKEPAKVPKSSGSVNAEQAPTATGEPNWQPWTLEAQNKAIAEGKTVFVDFTARWCATCQVNKRVYHDEDLQRDFAKAQVVTLKADWTRKDPAISEELRKLGRQGIPLNVFYRKGAEPVMLSELLTAYQVREGLAASLAGKSLKAETSTVFGMLVLAFFGGALLNLMPCVFPVIGLKVLSFARQGGTDYRTTLRQAFLYAFGVLVSFLALAGLILALKSGGSAVGWGFQMQSTGFVLATAVLMVTLGMSLAGIFEIGTGLASNVATKEGNAGAFFSGVLATVVATPCTAPGLGAALGFALDASRGTTETFCFFAVIGFGMALPYVLLAAFPALSRLLPRPGEWMETLKQAMSFPLFAYALYLLWVLNALVEDASWVRDASIGLVVIAACCWIWGRWGAPHRTDAERLWGRLVAGALYLGTVAHLIYYLP
jgi:thiol:disulfide interchange protein